jgi:hypothetical protein
VSSKKVIMVCMVIGSTVGSYLPSLWGGGWLSLTSIFLSIVGGLGGIWLGWQITQRF